MRAIVNGFKWLISTIKTLVSFLMNFFHAITMLFTYLIHIINVAFTTILTLPAYIQAFAYITIAISIKFPAGLVELLFILLLFSSI